MQDDVRVTWTPAVNPPSPVAQFKVYASVGNPDGPYDTLVAVVPASGFNEANINNLAPGSYNFAVSAVDEFSQEGPKSLGSNAIVVLAVPAPPGAPTNVGAVFI